jgi:hypothetical protein
MKLNIDLTTLVLSAVYVAEADGRPMSACDLAFMLDMPQAEVDTSLSQLVTNGSIWQDGISIHNQFERLRPVLEQIQVRLDS